MYFPRSSDVIIYLSCFEQATWLSWYVRDVTHWHITWRTLFLGISCKISTDANTEWLTTWCFPRIHAQATRFHSVRKMEKLKFHPNCSWEEQGQEYCFCAVNLLPERFWSCLHFVVRDNQTVFSTHFKIWLCIKISPIDCTLKENINHNDSLF